MPVEITVHGAEFQRFQKKLKTLDKDIQRAVRKEMNGTIRAVGRHVASDVQDAARSDLPHTGGLAERVASRPVKISVGMNGVTVRMSGMDAKSAERGRLRHPVYGNRSNWVNQSIRPGFFTRQMQRETPAFRRAIMQAVEQALEQTQGL